MAQDSSICPTLTLVYPSQSRGLIPGPIDCPPNVLTIEQLGSRWVATVAYDVLMRQSESQNLKFSSEALEITQINGRQACYHVLPSLLVLYDKM